MSILFPASLDALTNPTATDKVSVVDHATQHANVNDAVEALEAKVGVDSSAVTTSLDYKVKSTSSADPGHKHTEGSITLADVTTLDATSTKHGFAPKAPADATKFLNGAATPAFAQVKDSDLATTDVTTNNVSTSKHGFAPKGDGSTTKFLNANGAYSAPSVGSQFSTTQVYNAAAPGSYTDLDLSSVVGATQRMVLLVITNSTASGSASYFAQRKGTSYSFDTSTTTPIGVQNARIGLNLSGSIIVSTDTAGVIQWYSSLTAGTTQVNVEAYW